MKVRRATEADFSSVAALLAALGRPDVRDDPDGTHRRAFAAYLGRADAVALVAEDEDGKVVGFCDLEFRARLAFETEQAWIPDLIVDEVHRSRGVGATLLAEATRLSRDRGCWSLTLESASWRTRAHAFYEREGLVGSGLSFSLVLADLDWPPTPR